MIISDSRRLVFVHVQKTGGTTIDRTLLGLLPDARRIKSLQKHAPLHRILRVEPELSDYWCVGFVRNPWARMYSWFKMLERYRAGAAAGRPGTVRTLQKNQFAAAAVRELVDFETFVMQGPELFPRLRTPQVRYLRHGRVADFIGRQETLALDMTAVCARLELPRVDLPRLNFDRRPTDYREMYTPQMRDQVASVFEADITAFGYRF